MPTTDIEAPPPLANGHGLKPLTSPRKTPGSDAAPADHQTPTQDVAGQDRPQGAAEAGKEKGAGGGEAAGPPTPMRPQAAARRAETSPEGRSAEEDNAPPAVAAEQEAPLQPEDAQAEQCNGQGQANGLPNGKPTPARPLSFKRQGSSSSVNNQQPKNGRSSPIRNGRTSPPQSAKDAYVHAWRRDATPKRGPYDSYGFNGQQHNDTYQGMSWSGNAWGNAPRPNVRGPAPPSEPYPGDVPPVRYHQGTMHARYYPQAAVIPPHAVSMGGQSEIPQEPAWYMLDGHTYFTVWNPFTQRWCWNMAPRTQVPLIDEAHVGSPPQGAGYHPGFATQQNWTPQQHMAPQAFHQEYRPHQHMAQPQPGFGSAPTLFSGFPPDITPLQHFAGGNGGSDYAGTYHGHQPRHAGHNRNRQQGGGGPDRKAHHRRTQSSRPTEMGSQGSGGSSNSRRPSPTQQRGPDLPDVAQNVTLLDVLKDLAGMCGNQQGSRQVQELLIRATREEVKLFAEGFVKHPQAMDVIKDSFGNYVAQRLVQRADVAERMAISDTLLKPAMLELSGHQYGCRVIQAAIEHLPTIKDKCALAGLLKGQVLKYVLDSHGNHVVQCCFRHIRDREGDDSVEFMLEELSLATISLPAEGEHSLCQEREEAGFITVAKHVYGCRVVQRIMESCCLPGWKDEICHEVVQHASELAVTCYGNYVIQSCLALCSDEARELAFVDLLGQMDKLPFHKNASNVYERLLGVADEKCKKENLPPPRPLTADQLERFYKRIISSPGKEARPLICKLAPHQFGNYVAGACIVALKDQKDRLDEIVLGIRAELAAVELDAKAPKQLKERTKTLLEKVAKLKLKETPACSTIGSTTTGSSTSGA